MSDQADRLARLRERFVARSQEDIAALRNPDLPRADVQFIAHRIAGMAGLVGLRDFGEAARTLDQRIAQGLPYDDALATLLETWSRA